MSADLLGWFSGHRRDLPWRRRRDPYAIWVSEAMLQQTQVDAAIPYFTRFMQRFPTVRALAAATEDDVLRLWQGLGYYSRARALRRGAQMVVREHGGRVPATVEALRRLPGIGPYSAGAIASLAYGVVTPAVDGNVTRVLCRLHGLHGDPTRGPTKRRLWELARALVPDDRPGDFNEALIELGALVCLPRQPACGECPLSKRCVAHRDRLTDRLPETPRRPRVTNLSEVAALVLRRDRWLLEQIPRDAPRWAGMWRFPTRPELGALSGFAVGEKVGEIRYSVTRYRVLLEAYRCTVRGRGAGKWAGAAELGALAMPAAHRRLAALAIRPPRP